MENKPSIIVSFHEEANRIFFSFCQRLASLAGTIDREKNEFRFHQLKVNYANSLKQELENTASQLISKNASNEEAMHIGKQLSLIISEYLHRFNQKANNL